MLVEDNFVIAYNNIHLTGTGIEQDYPKIVSWTTDTPISISPEVQITANIIQRQFEPEYEWEYTGVIYISKAKNTTENNNEDKDNDQTTQIMFPTFDSFEEILNELNTYIETMCITHG